MLGPVRVKASDIHIPHLPDVNNAYWTYDWNKHDLDGFGYVCPNCGNVRIIKSIITDTVVGQKGERLVAMD